VSRTVFALAAALCPAAFLSNRPAALYGQPGAARGRCVGISTEKTTLPGVVRVYRAFENVEVEATDDGGNNRDWQKVGK
jgi:hypothetical protein